MFYMLRICEVIYMIIFRRNNLIIKWIVKLFVWRKIFGIYLMKIKFNELDVISFIFFFFMNMVLYMIVMGSYNY